MAACRPTCLPPTTGTTIRRPASGTHHFVKGATVAKTRIAKATKVANSDESLVKVSYDLFDLPSAFHKAGLVGLILLIESLKARQLLTADEGHYELTATAATVAFTESLARKLMDDIYDAEAKEVAVKSKWQGAEVSRPPTVAET